MDGGEKMFTDWGLENFLQRSYASSALDTVWGLIGEVKIFAAVALQYDDTNVVTLRYLGP
jgi:hypothetical protein